MILPLAYIDSLAAAGPPTANFAAPGFVEPHETFVLYDTSTGNPTSWKWYRNGVLFSTQRNPSVTLTSAGSYAFRLEVSNSEGSDEITRTVEVFYSWNPGDSYYQDPWGNWILP